MSARFIIGIGGPMRVYLASDDKGLSIRLANIINRSGNTCIMSDEDTGDYRVLIKDIRDSISGYDVSILVSKTPMEAVIEANKVGGVRAAVCKDVDDAVSAMQAKSNVIILDSSKVYRMDTRGIIKSIEDSFGNTAGRQRQIVEVQQKREKTVQQPATPQKQLGGGVLGSIKSAFGAGAPAPKEKPEPVVQKRAAQEMQKPRKAQEPQPQNKKGKGLFGSLKDTFGVE